MGSGCKGYAGCWEMGLNWGEEGWFRLLGRCRELVLGSLFTEAETHGFLSRLSGLLVIS